MLGQAQELTWQRRWRTTGMKDTVISRLSAKVADFPGVDAVRSATDSDQFAKNGSTTCTSNTSISGGPTTAWRSMRWIPSIPENLPDSIIEHSQEIISIGGMRIIESSMKEIAELATSSRNLVYECEERLRLEAREDDLMREREGSVRWTRTPSSVSSEAHWNTISKMRQYLIQGQESDSMLGDIYKSIEMTLEAYCGGQQSLLRCIPKNGHIQLDQAGEQVSFELLILSVVVDSFKRNPEKYQNPDGSIDQAKFEPVYEQHITFFNPDLAYLAQSKEQQVALEKKIDEVNQRFDRVKASSLSKSQEARLSVLQKLENDYVKYLELVQNLNSASKFYTAFLDRGNCVLKELDEYLLTRREEAREL
ncbi:hypothetical protein JCM33374_g4677 [Metschnikowia sp. JCM 33374]|nr:hypothetical protein JCM33374_g4677 [Metschnikowia sp. JCM 33374]